MGNVSIAVPDPESEAFINPARAARLGTLFVKASPLYSNWSKKIESKGSSSSSTNTDNMELKNSNLLLPAEGVLTVGPLTVGGGVSYDKGSYSGDYNHISGSSGSTFSSTNNYIGSTPTTTLHALASIDIGVMSLGAAGRTSSGTATYESKYSSTGGSSGESASETANLTKELRGGILLGSPDALELSAFLTLQSMKSESKPTKEIYNGVRQTIDPVPIGTNTSSPLEIIANLRMKSAERRTVGLRVGRGTSSGETKNKAQYYDGSVPVYEERKTNSSDVSYFLFGVGVAWDVAEKGLISFEFEYKPTTSASKSLATTSVLGMNNRQFNRGDVIYESEYKYTPQAIRVGAEFELSPAFMVRGGGEFMWTTSEYTSKDIVYGSTNSSNGLSETRFSGGGGFTYAFSPFRFDYSFRLVPYPYYSNSPYFSSFTTDVMFEHRASIAMQL
jgi:hypothetical protein